MWTATGLLNESDVEQKFLYGLLTEEQPLGLGIPDVAIQTKANIRRFPIDKGNNQKLYYPDYLVVDLGLPTVVIEAKHPDESVEEGFRQARLYAGELNGLYQHDLAPAHFVMASNGVELWYGYSDQAEPIGKANCSELGAYSPHLAKLVELIAWPRLQKLAIGLSQTLRQGELFKPRRLLGGVGVQNEEVAQNSFGATLTTLISPVFNPTTPDDRAFVARNAYIPSRRRERYLDPIDHVIRAARPPSEVQATAIDDSAKPTEIISKLKKPKELEHKVLLLIGSVGSGKSTFIDHLYGVALPRDLVATTVWCRMNMNAAPVSHDEIYGWLRREIIQGCKSALPAIDFDDLDTLQKIYNAEINAFKKGVGRLFEKQPETYATKLGEHIQMLQNDERVVANAHVRFTCGEPWRSFLSSVIADISEKTRYSR